MSRRSRKGTRNKNLNPIPIVIGMGIAVVAVIALVGIVRLFSPETPSSEPFPYERYIKNSRSMVGNTYSLSAKIQASEPNAETGGKRLVIMPTDATDDIKPLAIFINKDVKEKFPQLNLDVSSTYIFTLEVDDKSFLEVTNISVN